MSFNIRYEKTVIIFGRGLEENTENKDFPDENSNRLTK